MYKKIIKVIFFNYINNLIKKELFCKTNIFNNIIDKMNEINENINDKIQSNYFLRRKKYLDIREIYNTQIDIRFNNEFGHCENKTLNSN